jgi:hypothetical protein
MDSDREESTLGNVFIDGIEYPANRPDVEISYQTAPLGAYSPAFQWRASDLFQRVEKRLGSSRVTEYKGSYSIFAITSSATAAKIVIYESGKGKMNGFDPTLADGVYILIRTARTQGNRTRTLGIAPKHAERFGYFRLMDDQSLDEMADSIAACADSGYLY